MIKKIVILIFSLLSLNGCSGAVFEKGLNYEKTPNYKFKHDEGSHITTITNNKNGNRVAIGFGKSSCGFYGLIGPLIFPIIPIWENRDCLENATIGTGASIKNVHMIYQDKIYQPSKVVGGYTFPLPTKSITDTATLVVEKKDGEIFEIPFRYQHTFSFYLFPGR